MAIDLRKFLFKILKVEVAEALDLYERAILLVRRDKYMAWRGDALPDDCNGLLDRVHGIV